MVKFLSRFFALTLLLPGLSLFAQPAEFDFPTGCTQATPLNGEAVNFLVLAQVDGMNADPNGDFIAVFNGNGDVIGRSAISQVRVNGVRVIGATLEVRVLPGSNNCPTLNDAPDLTVRLYDASADEIYVATNSFFPATVVANEVDGPDGDASTPDLFNFLSASLPVDLVDFTATEHAGAVKLNWSTSSEIDNDRFEIQRSTNPELGFVNIGKVLGNETTSEFNTYEFTDANPGEGMLYYRLQQFDVDGTANFSPIVVVELEAAAERAVEVFPNPTNAGGRLTVRLNGPWTANGAALRLVDATGRQVAEWTGLSNGSLNTELPVVKAGVYQLIATDGKERKITRVVVR
ncbi:MAG: T9SS type A sorting domain-containing protein [Bacteroidota bacterium]